jgi:hypothetical protein
MGRYRRFPLHCTGAAFARHVEVVRPLVVCPGTRCTGNGRNTRKGLEFTGGAPYQYHKFTTEKGFRWAEDMGGMTLFNTIVPPTSNQYTFTYCGLGFANNNNGPIGG